MPKTATITSRGQLTLPREIRQVLDSSTVELEVVGNTVVLRPVKSVAGSLADYAGPKESLSEVSGKVWGEVARAKK